IALALQRPLAVMCTVREPSLDALHERVDHRRLHLVAQPLRAAIAECSSSLTSSAAMASL
ncbi:MAG TPA: hypothetical protein VGO80_20680, partial [Solirubrobacteraceae bacterium]|nr:hypothetical protein [Solirubrobacteraceae bacterium]